MDGRASTQPQLSDQGARLLAEVVANRASADRHDTVRSRAGAHRHARDVLRADVEVEPVVESLELENVSTVEASPEPVGPRWSPSLALFVVAVLAVGAMAGFLSAQSKADQTIPATEVLGAIEENVVATPTIAIGDVEVILRSAGPLRSGVRSLEIELTNRRQVEAIDTADVALTVETATGSQALTFIRFDRGEILPGDGVVATVRVEGATAQHAQVVLRHQGVELGRVELSS